MKFGFVNYKPDIVNDNYAYDNVIYNYFFENLCHLPSHLPPLPNFSAKRGGKIWCLSLKFSLDHQGHCKEEIFLK